MTTIAATDDEETAGEDATVVAPEVEPTIPEGETTESVQDSDEASDEESDDDSDDEADVAVKKPREKRPIEWPRVVAFGLLPAVALLLALTAGYFKWLDVSGTEASRARTESVRIAGEDAVALLSYRPDTAEKDLNAARERLTGEFKDAYTALTRQVVIPGAQEKRIAAVAKVSAASSVSATADHAVVLLFLNQTVTVGEGGTPTDTQPVVRVTLEKVDGRWLVSKFDPV